MFDDELLKKIKGGLIVSCQAEGDSPFNSPEGVTMFAKAAKMGGAVAIRSEGVEKTKMIIEQVGLPVIGLIKSKFINGYVRITGRMMDVENLVKIGCDMIAVDGTFRKREGIEGPEFIEKIKKYFDCRIMADISTFEEGKSCFDAGADCISTTLHGYTPGTEKEKTDKPNFELVKKFKKYIHCPVIAEGRITKPSEAKKMLKYGAWAVVVGTAITRPQIITKWYVDELKK